MSVLQKSVNSATLPILAVSKGITNFVKNSVSTYFLNINAQKHNLELQREIAKLKTKLMLKEKVEEELEEVKSLLYLTYTKDYKLISAEVLGNSSFSGLNLMLINKGSRQNVKEDQGVLSEKGVVGRVWRVFPGQSQVQLVSDNSSGVAVYLSSVNKGGIVAGTGKLEIGILKYISNTVQVKVGEKVFTSGTDGIFPRGVLVGEVVGVKKSKGFFQDILVKFSSDLSHLKYVFVVTGKVK